MNQINDLQIDKIGQLADKCDNVVAASKLRLPPQTHIEQMRESVEEMSKDLKSLYVQIRGENPWSPIR